MLARRLRFDMIAWDPLAASKLTTLIDNSSRFARGASCAWLRHELSCCRERNRTLRHASIELDSRRATVTRMMRVSEKYWRCVKIKIFPHYRSINSQRVDFFERDCSVDNTKQRIKHQIWMRSEGEEEKRFSNSTGKSSQLQIVNFQC